jgi:hypothetical protein
MKPKAGDALLSPSAFVFLANFAPWRLGVESNHLIASMGIGYGRSIRSRD